MIQLACTYFVHWILPDELNVILHNLVSNYLVSYVVRRLCVSCKYYGIVSLFSSMLILYSSISLSCRLMILSPQFIYHCLSLPVHAIKCSLSTVDYVGNPQTALMNCWTNSWIVDARRLLFLRFLFVKFRFCFVS